jgi:hypothetical protein
MMLKMLALETHSCLNEALNLTTVAAAAAIRKSLDLDFINVVSTNISQPLCLLRVVYDPNIIDFVHKWRKEFQAIFPLVRMI